MVTISPLRKVGARRARRGWSHGASGGSWQREAPYRAAEPCGAICRTRDDGGDGTASGEDVGVGVAASNRTGACDGDSQSSPR